MVLFCKLGLVLILLSKCSAVEVDFYLHVPENSTKQLLTIENFKTLPLSKYRTYKILFHGWTHNYSIPWYKDFITLYNAVGYNVIANDYGKSVSNLLYIPAVINANTIGTKIGDMIIHLVQKCDIGLDKFHLIGHSLGAHIAGYAGSTVSKSLRKKLARITGLDPAGPFFENSPASTRLSRDDARFVDVIHTNDMGIGISGAIGHADFYPNGGFHQGGCNPLDMSCNHRKALEYFTESIERNKFISKACSSYKTFPNKCRKKKYVPMGEHTDVRKARGRYYLKTNEKAPYGRGHDDLGYLVPFCKRFCKRHAKFFYHSTSTGNFGAISTGVSVKIGDSQITWINDFTKAYGFTKPVEPKLGEFPFQASLMQLVERPSTYHSFCGGSLIHREWVLTAAHCIQLDSQTPPMKADDIYVALGSIYRSAKGAQIIRAQWVRIHPLYLNSNANDLGLVKLRNPAKLGGNVKLVTLHTNNKENLVGATAYLTGFGIINDLYQMPERLRKAKFRISLYIQCLNDRAVQKIELCATSSLNEGKACKGDSGGPLTMKINQNYFQIGITSRLAILPFCGLGFNHSVYTRVSSFIGWISEITGLKF